MKIQTKKAAGSTKGCLIGYQILSIVETEVSTKGKLGKFNLEVSGEGRWGEVGRCYLAIDAQ